jgi:hypothetical protein
LHRCCLRVAALLESNGAAQSTIVVLAEARMTTLTNARPAFIQHASGVEFAMTTMQDSTNCGSGTPRRE